MPRRPQQRSTRREEVVVRRRIEWELAQKQWSYHDLARALTDSGHPTHPSAISKLLNGSPPRRITLNEFAALAEVLDRDPQELLVSKEVFLSDRANELLALLEEAQAVAWKGLSRLRKVFSDVATAKEFDAADRWWAVAQARLVDLERAIADVGDSYADLIERVYGMDDDNEYEPTEIGLREVHDKR